MVLILCIAVIRTTFNTITNDWMKLNMVLTMQKQWLNNYRYELELKYKNKNAGHQMINFTGVIIEVTTNKKKVSSSNFG